MRALVRAVTGTVIAVIGAQPATAVEPGLTVEQAVEWALERNPEILSLAADVDAAKARVEGASRLLRSNPTFEAELGPRLKPGDATSHDLALRLSQSVEIAGQRGARVDATGAALESAEANLGARKNNLRASIKEIFARALAARRRWELAREARTLAGQALGAAEERFRAGAAGQIEVNSARVEVGRALRDLAIAERERTGVIGELKLLLAWDPGVELEIAGDLGAAGRPVTPAPTVLLTAAREHRFELVAAARELRAAEAEEKLADREAFPDLQVGAAYAHEEGDDIILGTLGFDLPLFDRNQAARGVGTARVVQAKRSLEAVERRVEQEVRVAAARYDTARAAADAYAGDVITALEHNLDLANEAYRAGKFDFFQLMLIRRETLDARRGHIEALEELKIAEAALEWAVGSLP